MIDKFLNAKHWQIFLLTVGIPFGIQMVFMMSIFKYITQTANPDFELFFKYFKYFPILMLFFLAIFGAWLWSLAVGLQRIIPANIKLNIGRFKLFFFIFAVYLLFFLGFFVTLIDFFFTTFTNSGEPDIQPFASLWPFLPLIIVFHLFSMFCIIYCLIFVARTIKTAELQRTVSFREYMSELSSILFYPIGIWSIQPNVNKMVAENKNHFGDESIFPVLDNDSF